MTLGQTVFASGDEAEYIPVPGTTRKEYATDPHGQDWYRFRFDSDVPKLVYFQLELTDRDDLPVDVSIFRVQNGALVEYTRGQDPVAVPHEVQALPGNKFAPRILQEKGEYFARVRANHPEYKLRTRLYDVPPYSDPHEAVRTAVDYIMGAGDSWFANTPRRGGTLNRIAPVHQETSLCVACHASHFSQRAQLYSTANGYPVVQRQQLQFLEERFYNNPRPFYGFEDQGAVWARVISAPANVLSRMSVLTTMFEDQISREPRPAYHEHVKKYLDLYYADRSQLAADETNGNTPIVSTFEVAWYSWKTTHDPRLAEWIAAASSQGHQKHNRSLLPDPRARRHRPHKIQTANRSKCDPAFVPATARRAMVHALRSKGAGSRISNRSRIVGPGRRWCSRRSAAGKKGNRLPHAAPARFRRLDGSPTIVRKLPHALS